MKIKTDKPLITFALLSYNQESFIREAIESCFAQTYSPLEIILTDDCSLDATYNIMQDMVNKYCGDHLLILNRNKSNLGIARHVNRIFEIAHGELILLAAGDDISMPERAQVNYKAWEAFNRRSLCIFSGIMTMDKDGRPLNFNRYDHIHNKSEKFSEEKYSFPGYARGNKPLIVGGAAAWSPRLFDVFGPLPEDIVHEDEVLSLRTACLGSFTYISLPLIKYRMHYDNIHGRYQSAPTSLYELKQEESRYRLHLINTSKMNAAFIQDLETAGKKGLILQSNMDISIDEYRHQQKLLRMELAFNTSSFAKKCILLLQLTMLGIPLLTLRSLFYRLLPSDIYHSLKLWRSSHQNSTL